MTVLLIGIAGYIRQAAEAKTFRPILNLQAALHRYWPIRAWPDQRERHQFCPVVLFQQLQFSLLAPVTFQQCSLVTEGHGS